MKAVIIEDEHLSAKRLKSLLKKTSEEVEVIKHLDSVQTSLKWLKKNQDFDLLFLDIQLNDGTAFDILSESQIKIPIIFTTAYDEYAVKAFKFKSIDYLLKPIDEEELENAISQFSNWNSNEENNTQQLHKIIEKDFKKRFLIKIGEQFQTVEASEVSHFYFSEGSTYLVNKTGKELPIDFSLDHLEQMLNPLEFFRVNRKTIISISSILHIHTYFNSRLLLKLKNYEEDVIVSRERVQAFKNWIDC